MKKSTKIWLIIATSLVLFGCILFAGTMAILQWDFTKLSTVTYETSVYQIDEDPSALSIDVIGYI